MKQIVRWAVKPYDNELLIALLLVVWKYPNMNLISEPN
jgi:hypothetical protein